jgi:hypothetical protein
MTDGFTAREAFRTVPDPQRMGNDSDTEQDDGSGLG